MQPDFSSSLYREHLADASALYEQRHFALSDPDKPWREVAYYENTLEPHIDALVVGEGPALDVCAGQSRNGDAGETFAAVVVFCRQGRRDLALKVLSGLDPNDPEKASAIGDALKYELPEAWVPEFVSLLESGDPKLAPVLARAFGYRRLPCGPQLLTATKRIATQAMPEIVWALGRIRYQNAIEPLLDYLRSGEGPIQAAAALALLRLGVTEALDDCRKQAQSHSWPRLLLALAGGRSAVTLLTELLQKNGSADCITALGLLGDPVSVPLLVSQLGQSESAAPAATALQYVTGAGLYETVFVPDELEVDELFESEREQLKQGIKPTRGDGRAFGSNVTRISQNPEDWKKWWTTNEMRFTPGVWYRNGGPASPTRLVEMLLADQTPHDLRSWCLEELVTRYGKDFGIEIDTPVSRQISVLAEALAWTRPGAARFQEGAWYFAGHRLSD